MSDKDILDSWKAIADYLDRDIRTCSRWEKQLGLPIHRIDDRSSRSKVFAYKSEIDEWLREKANTRELKSLSFTENKWLVIGLISIFAFISIIFAFLYFKHNLLTSPSSKYISVAVFPFENSNPSEYEEYFSAGISEEIINNIRRLDALKVIPARSTKTGDNTSNTYQIGKNLDADFILKGKVEKNKEKISLYIQLIRTKNSENIWEEKFDGKMEDFFIIQEKICKKMHEILNLDTGKAGLIPSSYEKTYDYDAYDNYLKGNYILEKLNENPEDSWKLYHQGKYYWGKRTEEANELAIKLFNQAIKIDSSFAQAYLGLAHCYINYVNFDWNFNREWIEQAEVLANKARALSSNIPDYYTIIIQINLIKEIAFEENTKEIAFDLAQEGIQKYPNHALLNSIVGYCYFLKFGEEGKEEDFKKALDYKEKSFWLSPFSLHNNVYAEFLILNKEFYKAIEVCNITKKIDPSLTTIYRLGEIYYYMGDLDKSQEIFEKIESPWDFKIGASFYLGMIASRMGETEKARRIAEEIEVTSPDFFEEKLRLASIYMGLGEKEIGYNYLDSFFNKASTQKKRFIYYRYIDLDSNFHKFKREERFKKIIKIKE